MYAHISISIYIENCIGKCNRVEAEKENKERNREEDKREDILLPKPIPAARQERKRDVCEIFIPQEIKT